MSLVGFNDDRPVIARDEFVRIVNQASEGCTESTRVRLRRVVETTDRVAVGWFHCNGVGCPIRQAGRRTNQTFQERFDTHMAALFDAEYDAAKARIVPFVVEVEGA
jgi:hypothetical protein